MGSHEGKLKGAFKTFRNQETVFGLASATFATLAMAPSMAEASWRRATAALAMASAAFGQVSGPIRYFPVSERAGREVGCWIMAVESVGQLPQSAVFWYLDSYPTRAAAEAAKGLRGTVIEALGKVWLFTIGGAGQGPAVHLSIWGFQPPISSLLPEIVSKDGQTRPYPPSLERL